MAATAAGGATAARAGGEARAARTDRPADTLNTTIRPLWNGPDKREGKKLRPVSVAWLAAGSFASTPVGASRCCMGVTPSTDANSEETGGSVATWWATPPGTPSLTRPPDRVPGSVLDRPAIISVNTTPIETAVPEFWNVEGMRAAAPRARAGTEPLTEGEFGE